MDYPIITSTPLSNAYTQEAKALLGTQNTQRYQRYPKYPNVENVLLLKEISLHPLRLIVFPLL